MTFSWTEEFHPKRLGQNKWWRTRGDHPRFGFIPAAAIGGNHAEFVAN